MLQQRLAECRAGLNAQAVGKKTQGQSRAVKQRRLQRVQAGNAGIAAKISAGLVIQPGQCLLNVGAAGAATADLQPNH